MCASGPTRALAGEASSPTTRAMPNGGGVRAGHRRRVHQHHGAAGRGGASTAYSATLTAAGGVRPVPVVGRGRCAAGGAPPPARHRNHQGQAEDTGISTFTVQAVDTKDKVRPATQNSGTATLSLQVLQHRGHAGTAVCTPLRNTARARSPSTPCSTRRRPMPNGVIAPLLMDIFVPPDAATAPRPTIVEVHGGAFVGGSRTDEDWDAQQAALYGYVGRDHRLPTGLGLPMPANANAVRPGHRSDARCTAGGAVPQGQRRHLWRGSDTDRHAGELRRRRARPGHRRGG